MADVQLKIEQRQVSGFREAVRIQQSFITRAEKRALVWLAERTPERLNSDHLTILGAVGMFLGCALLRTITVQSLRIAAFLRFSRRELAWRQP
jgi:hypothetical protein